MKAEINSENKAKFFALYWGRTFVNGIGGNSILSFYDLNDISLGKIKAVLSLKPLSSISDEDLKVIAGFAHERYKSEWVVIRHEDKSIVHVECLGNLDETYHVSMIFDYATINANIHWPKTETEPQQSFKRNIGEIDVSSRNPIAYILITDYLRSKGYALPWMGLSVEEMISAGWIRLLD